MTLSEISKIAGVSITTVHRVLAGKEEVHPDTVARIKSIITENGYRPKTVRNNLKSHKFRISNIKSGNIGVFLSGLTMEYLQLPQNIKVISKLETELSQNHLSLIVVQETKNQSIEELIRADKFDGLIVMGDIPSKTRNVLRNFPCVGIFGSNFYDMPRIDWILPDYQARARLAVNYLKEKGHKNIAFINPAGKHIAFEEIGLEFMKYAGQIGISARIFEADKDLNKEYTEREEVERMVSKFIKIPIDEKPSGLFVANDEVAMDIYFELGMKGIKIGEDVEILSSDNTEVFLSRLSPRPVSIDLNYNHIVELAVGRLLSKIENPQLQSGIRILVPPKIDD